MENKELVAKINALYLKAIEGMPAKWKSHCILPPEHATRLHTIQDDKNPPCYIIADGLYPRHGEWLIAIHNAWPVIAAALEDAQQDAERYLQLRDNSLGQWEHPIVVSQTHTERGMQYVGPLVGKELDAAIDAARREK